QESVLQYHRPLLEDGTIEYEFFHEPGQSIVHPALDRLALLLEPNGIKVHWLTDGPNERNGFTPENATDEPARRRGPGQLPLKTRDWNRLKVALSGDTVRLTLNGVMVYERPLEPT